MRQDLIGGHVKPGVGALFGKHIGDGLDGVVVADRLAAVLAVHHGDGQAPTALTGDAPVIALADHALDAVLTPGGDPAHLLTGGGRFVFERIHGAEPLRRGAEDDGVLAAPAVGVAVDDVLAGKQGAGFLHVFENDGVGLLGGHTGVLAGIVGVAALIVHGHHHLHAVAQTGQVVVCTEAGGGMDAAGTGFHGHIVGQQQAAGLGQEGMTGQHILVEAAVVGLQNLIAGKAADAHDLLHQSLGHDIHLIAVIGLDDSIALIGMQGNGQVAGQGPDGGGPDHEEQLAAVQMAQLAQIVVHGELHIHGGAGVVLVLDLRLSQCGFVVGAPVNRLQALVDVALLIHLAKDLDLLGLKFLIHGLVGMLPVTHHAHALEALHLQLNIFLCVVAAGTAEVGIAHGLVVELLLLDNGALDGHAVVIPTGDIGGIVAAHGIAAGDKVLQRLIQRVAHVDVAVGKRRAVVQAEQGLALVLFQQLVVKVQLLPVCQHIRLALGQTGAHGKAAFGHVQCLFVFHVCSSIYDIF